MSASSAIDQWKQFQASTGRLHLIALLMRQPQERIAKQNQKHRRLVSQQHRIISIVMTNVPSAILRMDRLQCTSFSILSHHMRVIGASSVDLCLHLSSSSQKPAFVAVESMTIDGRFDIDVVLTFIPFSSSFAQALCFIDHDCGSPSANTAQTIVLKTNRPAQMQKTFSHSSRLPYTIDS